MILSRKNISILCLILAILISLILSYTFKKNIEGLEFSPGECQETPPPIFSVSPMPSAFSEYNVTLPTEFQEFTSTMNNILLLLNEDGLNKFKTNYELEQQSTDPKDPKTQSFFSIFLLLNGRLNNDGSERNPETWRENKESYEEEALENLKSEYNKTKLDEDLGTNVPTQFSYYNTVVYLYGLSQEERSSMNPFFEDIYKNGLNNTAFGQGNGNFKANFNNAVSSKLFYIINGFWVNPTVEGHFNSDGLLKRSEGFQNMLPETNVNDRTTISIPSKRIPKSFDPVNIFKYIFQDSNDETFKLKRP